MYSKLQAQFPSRRQLFFFFSFHKLNFLFSNYDPYRRLFGDLVYRQPPDQIVHTLVPGQWRVLERILVVSHLHLQRCSSSPGNQYLFLQKWKRCQEKIYIDVPVTDQGFSREERQLHR